MTLEMHQVQPGHVSQGDDLTEARAGTALHPSVNVVEAGGQVDRHPLVPVAAVGSLLKRRIIRQGSPCLSSN